METDLPVTRFEDPASGSDFESFNFASGKAKLFPKMS